MANNFLSVKKKLNYRRGTARRAVSVEILSTAEQRHQNAI